MKSQQATAPGTPQPSAFVAAELAAIPVEAPKPIYDAQSDSRRAVFFDMQRQAKIADVGEQDDREAATVRRLKKASETVGPGVSRPSVGGRPEETRGQLLTDVSRLVRDRAQYIIDAAAKLKQ
eukprot:1160791-Pyramimonas_sp.AAC.1